MPTNPDPKYVLEELAATLSIEETLKKFPEIGKDELADLLEMAAAAVGNRPPVAVLMIDGAARGNPGPAGAGVVLKGAGDRDIQEGVFIGEATNNVAEYSALIHGLELARKIGLRDLLVQSDSQLLVRQMKGEYRVKNENLKKLFAKAQETASHFDNVSYLHVPREKNRQADSLANMAVDAKGKVFL